MMKAQKARTKMNEPVQQILSAEVADIKRYRRLEGGRGMGSSSGGGGGSDDIRDRVGNLERDFNKIIDRLDGIKNLVEGARLDIDGKLTKIELKASIVDTKLDAKAGSAELNKIGGEINAKMIGIERDLIGKASASDLSLVKGGIDKLPTTIQLLGFIVAVFVAAGVAKHFGW
ncbi:hypothetical protein [Methylobacterium sp. SyP6R]|uniref:hypothetical protein n=1 Tax=Methylobacterium sp. SyP6R TaxID=2718876 RepID=UPI001F2EC9E6|nr:hypothetical protein [Methylobacterium sp. SyP6R]MCF4123812.1 hypothetical protein [Methylobacterium sp. SyP6R]